MNRAPRQPLETLVRSHFGGRRVLLTGHTGFVGSWLANWLATAGADLLGVSLPDDLIDASSELSPPTTMEDARIDIRDRSSVASMINGFRPEFVFHLAAQALVLRSYEDPITTFETNVLGGANVLDSIRATPSVLGCVFVTSDKCYANAEEAHDEKDPLGGDDPYSASKGAAEIVAHAYRTSFLAPSGVGLATARAGNILGGGDLGMRRIIPDCVRAVRAGAPVELRHPEAVRPWQHVLDAVAGYLRLACSLLDDPAQYAAAWNFGPAPNNAAPVIDLVARFMDAWRRQVGETMEPIVVGGGAVERQSLLLNSEKAHSQLGWRTLLNLGEAIDWTVQWYRDADGSAIAESQIARYEQIDRGLVPSTNAAELSPVDG